VTLVDSERITGETGPERLPLGEVVEISSHIEEFTPESEKLKPGRYFKRLGAVGDIGDPKERAKLNAVLDLWDRFLLEHDKEYPIPTMKNGYKENPASEWFYNHEEGLEGTMKEWGDELVPSARALYPMQVVDDMERVFPSGTVTERARRILELSDDAVAIRARAAIMKSIAVETATKMTDMELKLVSLGAGAAVPAIIAVQEIEKKLGKKMIMDLYDQDENILKEFAKESIERAGIPSEHVTPHVGSYEKFYTLEDASVDILEALGLWEYLPTSRCVELMTNAYRVIKPGGVIVISNMLKGRKQLAVNQRAVKWPGVKPRTETELIEIAVKAGVPVENITYIISEDGVYGILEVHKP
jgi:SAM-dependent methyltransferase